MRSNPGLKLANAVGVNGHTLWLRLCCTGLGVSEFVVSRVKMDTETHQRLHREAELELAPRVVCFRAEYVDNEQSDGETCSRRSLRWDHTRWVRSGA
jgi:hypothetical protein